MLTEVSKKTSLLHNYNRYPIELVEGDGFTVKDQNGNSYLDFLSGIAVTNFGHNNKQLINAAVNQLNKIWHTSNLFSSSIQENLATVLTGKSGMDKVFFCNSGTEANEAAIKFARKFGNGRTEIITTINSFHGRSMGSLSATGQYKLWKNFTPLLPGFRYVPYNDIEAIENSITTNTVAIMLEPIQGEGGVFVPDEDYFGKIRELCDKHNLLMIVDEVQTGFGRTGKIFSYQWYDILPDIVSSAKGIANGLPLGATLCNMKVAETIEAGDHGSTFGGNPVTIAIATKVSELLDDKTLNKINNLGNYFLEKLNIVNDKRIINIRGKGLMIGVQFDDSIIVRNIAIAMQKEGIIVGTSGQNTLRILPPFIITENEINIFVEKLQKVLENI